MTAPAPKALPPAPPPSMFSLRHLFELQLELEKKLRDGPWDRWDGELLERWRNEADEAVRACSLALEVELEDARQLAPLIEVYESEIRWLRAIAVASDDIKLAGRLAERAGHLQEKLDDARGRIRLL